MFMYTRDFGWAGCIVVIASSREEASRIVDENPGKYDRWKKGDMVEGPDKDANGHWIQVEYRGEVPPEEWAELPLAAGTIFRCEGDQ